MRKFLIKKSLFIFSLLFLIYSCTNDIERISHDTHLSNKPPKIRKLFGKDAEIASNLLVKYLEKNENNALLNKNRTGEIDYSAVAEAIDYAGNINYTFRIINHPDDDHYTFHNLVLNVEDNEYKTYLLKYVMSESTAAVFHATGKLQDFEGTVTSFNFGGGHDPEGSGSGTGSGSSGCGPTYTGTGSNGGGSNPGTGTGPGTGTSSGGGNGGTTNCSTMSISCDNCGASYGSWAAFGDSACKNYPITVYLSFYACRLPCNPAGAVVVVGPENNNCDKTKNLISDPKTKTAIDFLKNNSSAGGEKGVMFKADGTPSAIIQGGEHSVNFGDKSGYQGGYHNHTPTGIPMLSPPDVDQLLGFALAQGNTGVPSNAYLGMVAPNGMHYVITFNGSYNDALVSFSQEQIDDFVIRYKARYDMRIPYNGDMSAETLEKILFKSIKDMGLEGKINLQRIENNGVIKSITKNSDGSTTATPCP